MTDKKKNPMKMKRVDVEDTGGVDGVQGGDPAFDMGAEARSNAKPVTNVNGVAVVGDKDDMDSLETKTLKNPDIAQQEVQGVAQKTQGVVTVGAPEEQEMEEVSYEDWAAEQAKGGLPADPDVAKSVHDFVGEGFEKLKEWFAKNNVTKYRFVPVGAPMTMELRPGHVQVLVDGAKFDKGELTEGRVVSVDVS